MLETKAVRKAYFKKRGWLDCIAVCPWELLALGTHPATDGGVFTAWRLGRVLRVGRVVQIHTPPGVTITSLGQRIQAPLRTRRTQHCLPCHARLHHTRCRCALVEPSTAAAAAAPGCTAPAQKHSAA